MPRRPPESPIQDLVGQTPFPAVLTKSPVVITSINMVNITSKPDLTEFKPLSSHMANPHQNVPRPSTSQGVVKQPRRMSFSRPLTSDGPKTSPTPAVPKLPAPIQTHVVSDPARIGVAMGSPTQDTHRSPQTPRATGYRRPMRVNTDEPLIPLIPEWSIGAEPTAQPKLKRWRSVGSLFKKKRAAVRPPSPIFDEEEITVKASATGAKHVPMAHPSGSQEKWPTRKSSMRPRLRSRSVNKAMEVTRAAAPPSVPRKAAPTNVIPPAASVQIADAQTSGSPGPWSDMQEEIRRRRNKPQLDVAIPTTEFERYSVMFSGLLLKEPATTSPARPSPAGNHSDTETAVQSSHAVQTQISDDHKSIKARDKPFDKPVVNPANNVLAPPTLNTSVRSSQGSSTASSTPKMGGYSLFPQVKASPSTSPQPQLARSDTPESTNTSLKVPSPTPNAHFANTAPLPADHIISQHVDPITEPGRGLGLDSRFSPLGPKPPPARHAPSPLGQIEPRSLRSPDFSPDSPVSRASTSSTWSSRPSISHSHKRSKSSGHLGHSPGPSISSYIDSYHTPTQQPEPELMPHLPHSGRPSRTDSLRQAGTAKNTLNTSPRLGYEAPISPRVAVARQISVTGSGHKPQMLVRTSSKKNKEEGVAKAKLQENNSRAGTPQMVNADNSDRPDEETWLQRRSRWGIIEEGGRVVC